MEFSYYEMFTVLFVLILYCSERYKGAYVLNALYMLIFVWFGVITISSNQNYVVYAIALMIVNTILQIFYIQKRIQVKQYGK